jgi:hypothetical protein
VFEDLRIIDMYESAIRADVPELDERTGNWVQKYQTPEDILLFASAQFSRYAEVKAFIEGSIRDRAAIVARRDEVAAQTPAARSTQPNDKTGGDAK